jgi:hypothetical protein
MDIIADILLAAGAVGAGIYCFVLGRRLNRFNDLEKGVGGAVAVLSAQVDDLNRTLAAARQTASGSAATLTDLTQRAEDMSRRLELQMASLHDIPAVPTPQPAAPPPTSSKPAAPMFARRTHATATGDIA